MLHGISLHQLLVEGRNVCAGSAFGDEAPASRVENGRLSRGQHGMRRNVRVRVGPALDPQDALCLDDVTLKGRPLLGVLAPG